MSTYPTYYWIFIIDKEEKYTLIYPRSHKDDNLLPSNEIIHQPNNRERWVLNTDYDQIEEKNTILIITNPLDVPVKANSITDFNSWANWYKTLDSNEKHKQIFNLSIYHP